MSSSSHQHLYKKADPVLENFSSPIKFSDENIIKPKTATPSQSSLLKEDLGRLESVRDKLASFRSSPRLQPNTRKLEYSADAVSSPRHSSDFKLSAKAYEPSFKSDLSNYGQSSNYSHHPQTKPAKDDSESKNYNSPMLSRQLETPKSVSSHVREGRGEGDEAFKYRNFDLGKKEESLQFHTPKTREPSSQYRSKQEREDATNTVGRYSAHNYITTATDDYKKYTNNTEKFNEASSKATAANDHPAKPSKSSATTSNIPEMIQNLVESGIKDAMSDLRNDIQNLHVDTIKYSVCQKDLLQQLIESIPRDYRNLVDEVKELRKENERLRFLKN